MDILLPGFHRLPRKVRRIIGHSLLGLIALLAVVPIVAFASMGPACGGGYPDKWCQPRLDTLVDSWGMYNRECVSYTAWKVASTGRYMPYGFGDANKWPAAARVHNIPVDSTPRAGDIAIRHDSKPGAHGHSMYVEAVNPDGTIRVSQYNLSKTGRYSEETVSSTDLVFIHF